MKGTTIIKNMLKNDFFSRWLGIVVLESGKGQCKLSLQIRKEMLNGFGIAHGGITYSMADSALAFASNYNGIKSLSIETSIAHLVSIKKNDEIIAIATCEAETEKLGHYKVVIFLKNDPKKIIALFKGMVYKTSKHW